MDEPGYRSATLQDGTGLLPCGPLALTKPCMRASCLRSELVKSVACWCISWWSGGIEMDTNDTVKRVA